ncbi:hypothetical protein ABFV99_02290 [Cytobacillus horneckiae]|uniref:hypothetical protein n=1 Tax=Cytobacillus horneckiae TaxID=549687 RepID=UPI0034CDB49D
MKHNVKRKYEFLLNDEAVELLDIIRGKMASQLYKEGYDPEYCTEVIADDDVLMLEILRKVNSYLLLLLKQE